ncbi:protein-export chaperone SecB [Candidatus Pelagibacter sp.]|nr:protein-export chaperone SecB [Candidatus Pelagibacter sp.]
MKTTMTEKYKILSKYIKDMSSETPNLDTYLFVRDYISSYQLNIDINSKAIKNKMIEINTIMKFEDKQENKKKSYFEIKYSTVIKVGDDVKEKKDLEKIILCDVQIEIYPKLEKSLLDLLHNSGYPGVRFEKKIDFEKLYNQRSN